MQWVPERNTDANIDIRVFIPPNLFSESRSVRGTLSFFQVAGQEGNCKTLSRGARENPPASYRRPPETKFHNCLLAHFHERGRVPTDIDVWSFQNAVF